MTSSSGLSQVPLSDFSDPPTDFEIPHSSPVLRQYSEPSRIQRPSRIPRTVRLLPFELREQSRILLEETLYSQALRLLQTALTAGRLSSDPTKWRPAFVAPPAQLALIATLAVHPSLTTKSRNEQKLLASGEAATYLRLVQSLVGPADGNLSTAYVFPDRTSSTRRGISIRQRSKSPGAEAAEIASPLATHDSVWIQGKDFWSIVGWAFNCSVKVARRWDVWAPWLDHMSSVLNEDWKTHRGKQESSLIATYLRGHDGRRVARAIFADGGKTSLQEFGEVWQNEAAKPKAKKRTHEKVEVNFELDEFGDYMKDSSEEEENGKTIAVDELGIPVQQPQSQPDPLYDEGTPMGGAESLELRMKLLALLMDVSSQSPKFFVDTDHFVESFVTCTRPLQLDNFRTVLSLFTFGYFSISHATFVVQSLACSFIESSAPRDPTEELSQTVLAARFLPWAANTTVVADNAKLSICIETLLRLHAKTHEREAWDESMSEALRGGIEKRKQKAQRQGKGKTDPTSQRSDMYQLSASEERLKLLAKIADLQCQ